MIELFFDTETTGMYNFKGDPSDADQPDLIQLGAILRKDGTEYTALKTLVQPAVHEISPEAEKVHGISMAAVNSVGIPPMVAVDIFDAWLTMADIVIGHNVNFDVNIMKTAYYRSAMAMTELPQLFCTMRHATNICKLPGPYGYKWPKLSEALRILYGEELADAHDAMNDVIGTVKVYDAICALRNN